MSKRTKLIIGRKDFVNLPEVLEDEVKVKVDTGADRSSIHATRMKLVKVNGEECLQCYLLNGHKYRFQEFSKIKVKSSNGESESRFVVKLKMKVFGKVYDTSFTLANRKRMSYPILLGKTFLRNRFVVDVSKMNLSQKGTYIQI